ncbi:MAG TPA: GxxExxY protein [Caulobacteraceae bacterium]|nr:GxxExxY protein [Caulobacteraceae bacterium]
MSHEEHEGSKAHEGVPLELERLSRTIVDAGLKVHRALGPGLLESVYEHCLAYELERRGVAVRRQVILPVTYEDLTVEAGYRLDLLAADQIIIEVKSVEALTRLHEAQALTYLRLSRKRMALLMNFNVVLLKQGLRRILH